MIFYVINILIIIIFILLLIIFKKSDIRWSKINDYLGKVTNTVDSVRYGNLSTKIEAAEHYNYQNLSESINRMVETLNDREEMIVEYQNELTRQNKFLEAIINSLSDGILIIDEHHKILRATPKIAQWFDEDGENLLGKDILDYLQSQNNVKPEKFKNEEIFIKENVEASFEATTMKLKLDDKKKRFVIIIKNITNQKELEKIREDFVATLTHDLKVPIVAESNILEFLISGKFGELDEKQQEAVKNMKSCNQELLDLVQILLETYKINETGIELEKTDFNLNKLICSVIDEMHPIAEKSSLSLIYTPQYELQAFVDEISLKRVIKNLIQNAISHSNSNSDINVMSEEHEGNIYIKIIDYGKGIPKEDIDKIFNKYYSTAKKFRKIGTGLGLYLSQQIIKAHGGEIFVSSEENVRTEFCIKLPK